MFTDVPSAEADTSAGYTEEPDLISLQTRLEETLHEYNGLNAKAPLSLALFLYAIEHVCRVLRVLRMQGHIVNVGVGGSGRTSLSILAAYLQGMVVHQVEVGSAYGLHEWREDLRRFCRVAGAAGRPGVLLLGDAQLKDEAFLEDVNSLLNSGEVCPSFRPIPLSKAAVACACDCLSTCHCVHRPCVHLHAGYAANFHYP